jgi:hypothetical protein
MDNVRDIAKEDFHNQKNNDDKIKFLLRYAVLAPSTHNSQPWLFRVGDGSCQISYDKDLLLSEVDPLERDLYISLGCMVENLILAAKYFGVFKNVEYFFENELVGEIFFDFSSEKEADKKTEHLLDAMLVRNNVRGKFDVGDIDENITSEIVDSYQKEYLGDGQINFIRQKDNIGKIAKLTAKGMQLAHSQKIFRSEMSNWINNNLSRKKDGIPGYTMEMPTLLSFIVPKMVKYFNLGKILGKKNYSSLKTAPLITVLSTEENNYKNWVNIGRMTERIFLEFTAKNIKSSIFVASIEMGDLYKDLQKVIGTDFIPQFLFVSGYKNKKQKYSLRHPVEDKLIK